jgi:UDP-N-acetylglucosamine--N-acetylmuramyl-(pentapeptide) pyrophosphoryl-undecaprenol N-acetylglucosamine transferase
MKKIIFAGGGTGGHFYPIIAISRCIRDMLAYRGKDVVKFYFIAPDATSQEDLEKEEITFHKITSGKIKRYLSLSNLLFPGQVTIGFFQSVYLFLKIRPTVVFLKGGYGSVPVGLAAVFLKIPLFIHEPDTRPGLVSKFFYKFSKITFISFEETEKFLRKTNQQQIIKLVGNPVRTFKYKGNKFDARKKIHILTNRPLVLALGGSQGAEEINELIFNLIKNGALNTISIIHIVGKQKFDDYYKKIAGNFDLGKLKSQYKFCDYCEEEDMAKAYTACDFVISRAGSGMIFEIAQASKPSMLMPLAGSASNHQFHNARSYEKIGACVTKSKFSIDPSVFVNELVSLVEDRKRMQHMGNMAKKFSKPKAAQDIATQIVELML